MYLNDEGDGIREYEGAFQGSGLFDMQSRKWVIPRNFVRLYPLKEKFIAIHLDSAYYNLIEDNRQRFAITYFIYEKKEDEYVVTDKTNEFNKDWISNAFDVDSISWIKENTFYSYKGDKKGLVYAEPYTYRILFDYELRMKELLPPVYDLVHLDSTYRSVFTLDSETAAMKQFYLSNGMEDIEKVWENDGIIFEGDRVDYSVSRTAQMLGDTLDLYEIPFHESRFLQSGVEYINDSLVKIFFNSPGYLLEAKSIEYPDEDSIDVNGEVVYTREGFSENTGIYNYKNDEWILSPNYWSVHFAGDHFATLSQDGEVTFLDLSETSLGPSYKVEEFIKVWYPFFDLFPRDTYTNLYGLGDSEMDSFTEYPAFQCIKPNGKMDVFVPGTKNLKPYQLLSNVDFGIADPNSFSRMYVDDGLIYLEFNDTVGGIELENGELIFEYHSAEGTGNYTISQISDGDTTSSGGAYNEVSWGRSFDQLISIKSGDQYLIVNHIIQDKWKIYHYIESVEVGDHFEETEYSALWEKTEIGYEKVTATYASIHDYPFGFLARTAENSGYPTMTEWEEYYFDVDGNLIVTGALESRYILLDSNLMAIELLDHYDFDNVEDLGFGLKVSTDKGSMFVTYEGEAITTDKWDDFKLAKDGRLMAIQKPKFDEFAIDMVSDGIVAFFQLPKK